MSQPLGRAESDSDDNTVSTVLGSTKRYTYQDISDKGIWEGGLEDALEWFKPEEVPEEIETKWAKARALKADLERSTDELAEKFREAGVEYL